MSNYEFIRLERRESLTWIVLDRPSRANAFSTRLLEEFSDALDSLKNDGGPVIGIRGAGQGFSAGYDLGEVGSKANGGEDPVGDRDRLSRNIDRFWAIWDHPKPVIAAVHGYCIAGATQMCVLADITVVTHDARIGEPKLPIGGGYIAPLWAPLVGPKRAKELAFVPGNSIDGRTSVEWGWANHSVEPDELVTAVESLAQRIARIPPDVLRIKKLSINRAMESMGVRQAAAAAPEMDALLHLSPSVASVRQLVHEAGMSSAIEAYRSTPSSPLIMENLSDG